MEILPGAEGVRIGDIVSKNNGDAANAVLTNRILNSVKSIDGHNFVCVDIGAAQGWWTVLAARHGYGVIAFEPDVSGFSLLVENTKQFGPQIDAIQMGISDVDGEQTLHMSGEQSFFGGVREMSGDKDACPDWPTTTMRTARLDTVLTTDDLKEFYVPLIKIDTEGHEPSVIAGMGECLQSGRIMNMITEFTVYWYGEDAIAATSTSVSVLKKIGEHLPYIYILSRVGSIFYVGPVLPNDYEVVCGALYNGHLQVDLACLTEPIDSSLPVVSVNSIKMFSGATAAHTANN